MDRPDPWLAHWLEQRRREAELPFEEQLRWVEEAGRFAAALAESPVVEAPEWAKTPPGKR